MTISFIGVTVALHRAVKKKIEQVENGGLEDKLPAMLEEMHR